MCMYEFNGARLSQCFSATCKSSGQRAALEKDIPRVWGTGIALPLRTWVHPCGDADDQCHVKAANECSVCQSEIERTLMFIQKS